MKNDMLNMLRLNPKKGMYWFLMVINVLRMLVNTTVSALALQAIGDSIVSQNATALWTGIAVYVPVTVVGVTINYLSRIARNKVFIQMRNTLRADFALQCVSHRKKKEMDTDALYTRMTEDSDAIVNFNESFYYFLNDMALFVSSLFVGMVMNWRVCIFLMVLGIVKIWLNKALVEKMERVVSERIENNAQLLGMILEVFKGQRTFRFLNPKASMHFFETKYAAYKKSYRAEANYHANMETLDVSMNFLAAVTLVIVNAIMMALGWSSAGTLMSFLSLQDTLANPLTFIADFLRDSKAQALSYRRYTEAMEGTGIPDTTGEKDMVDEVKLNNVSFAYGKKTVLRGFTNRLHKGEITYLVGESGGGKTTLAKLMLHILQPDAGRIVYRNEDKIVQPKLAYVSQTPLFVNGSIAQNIALNDQVDKQRLQNALKIAHIQETLQERGDVERFHINAQGDGLSLGQKVRVALARAVYQDAQVIVLDEPFSALDNAAIAAILPQLEALAQQGRVLVMITHRREWIPAGSRVIEVG